MKIISADYRRVSTDDQRKGYGLQDQAKANAAYALEHGLHVPDDYHIEDDETGYSMDRSGLVRLRQLAADRKIKAIVIHRSNRLSRNARESLILRDELLALNIQIHIVAWGRAFDPHNNTDHLLWNVEAAVSDYDRRAILAQLSAGRRRKAESQKWVGNGRPPYGYIKVGERKQTYLKPDASKLKIVRGIFDALIIKRKTQTAIAKDLNRRGVLTTLGADWNAETVNRIATNPIYAGYKYYGDIRIELPGLAIIDQTTFDLAQVILRANKEAAARNRKRSYPLSGHLRCTCGRAMGGHYTQQNGIFYQCNQSSIRKEKRDCPVHFVTATQVEKPVWAYVVSAIEHADEDIAQAQKAAGDAESDAGQIKTLEAEIARLNKRVDTLLARFGDSADAVVLGAVERQVADTSAQIKKLSDRRNELADGERRQALKSAARSSVLSNIRTYRELAQRADFDDKRALFTAIDLQVVLSVEPGGRFLVISSSIAKTKRLKLKWSKRQAE